MTEVSILGSDLLLLPVRFPSLFQETLGMALRNTSVEDKTLPRSKPRNTHRGQRASLSPSAFENLSLSSRTPPSHAILPCSQQGSPVMTSTYLSHTTLGPTQNQRDLSQFHMGTARSTGSPHQFEAGFVANSSYGSFYNNCSTTEEAE